jgi:hypothetical protein
MPASMPPTATAARLAPGTSVSRQKTCARACRVTLAD